MEVSMKQEKNDLAEKMERQNSLLEDAESRCENLIDAKIDLDGKIRDLQDLGSNQAVSKLIQVESHLVTKRKRKILPLQSIENLTFISYAIWYNLQGLYQKWPTFFHLKSWPFTKSFGTTPVCAF